MQYQKVCLSKNVSVYQKTAVAEKKKTYQRLLVVCFDSTPGWNLSDGGTKC